MISRRLLRSSNNDVCIDVHWLAHVLTSLHSQWSKIGAETFARNSPKNLANSQITRISGAWERRSPSFNFPKVFHSTHCPQSPCRSPQKSFSATPEFPEQWRVTLLKCYVPSGIVFSFFSENRSAHMSTVDSLHVSFCRHTLRKPFITSYLHWNISFAIPRHC